LDLVSVEEKLTLDQNLEIKTSAVHLNGEIIVNDESNKNLNILIYQYPSMKLYRILKGGKETVYYSMIFHLMEKSLIQLFMIPIIL
jgi:hypothetical protein